ncbi:hypothetical protein L1987_24090 [Smallanthus sonchifolius]|uniref:Uncharacterized protein n=1 Tax=Smallanthus sonchifolius TaxID=185202 RepID=A0ACB9IL81_9ASTR|nr:hypothetical protein L1987_24090 [Smallanthus sonchifolius]
MEDMYSFMNYIGIVQNKFDGRTTRNDRYLRVLEDRNNQDISLTIWKETLATFDSAAPAATSTQVTTFAGRLHLATTAASSLYLNPAISIGQTLINGLKQHWPRSHKSKWENLLD